MRVFCIHGHQESLLFRYSAAGYLDRDTGSRLRHIHTSLALNSTCQPCLHIGSIPTSFINAAWKVYLGYWCAIHLWLLQDESYKSKSPTAHTLRLLYMLLFSSETITVLSRTFLNHIMV
ncbi:Uncharacterized protein HZ326_23228 [Fusarium oxysporum f. sp. albedinis]|nr:Uncharacterized protein HZ326_23228 [Fusarium oxysporum f. sp. albedinis]